MPLPTAPRGSESETTVANTAPLRTGHTPEEAKAKADAEKAVKDEKKAMRMETERRAKEAKEAAAAADAALLEKQQSELAVAMGAAADAVASGLRGTALVAHCAGMEVKPSGAALLKAVLTTQDPDQAVSSKWWTKEQFGEVLKVLLADTNVMEGQVLALYAVQAWCHANKFPKKEVGGKLLKVIEVLFTLLANGSIVDPDAFVLWADDDNLADVPGRVDAIVQTTAFVQLIREADAEDYEEADEDEIDAPRQFL
ncbi:hypothetical protein B484DRAFT_231855 [Ochromonadaceae sp. CCMP2298]|nr:hypothetical protein B484DRAFT_231855 [Ochromonadaceae sp. CCMP2298]